MSDIAKMKKDLLARGITPDWSSGTGVPLCVAGCRKTDRGAWICSETGMQIARLCEPAVALKFAAEDVWAPAHSVDWCEGLPPEMSRRVREFADSNGLVASMPRWRVSNTDAWRVGFDSTYAGEVAVECVVSLVSPDGRNGAFDGLPPSVVSLVLRLVRCLDSDKDLGCLRCEIDGERFEAWQAGSNTIKVTIGGVPVERVLRVTDGAGVVRVEDEVQGEEKATAQNHDPIQKAMDMIQAELDRIIAESLAAASKKARGGADGVES